MQLLIYLTVTARSKVLGDIWHSLVKKIAFFDDWKAFFSVCMQVDRLDRLAEFVLHFMASFMYTVGPHVGSCLDRKIYLSRNF